MLKEKVVSLDSLLVKIWVDSFIVSILFNKGCQILSVKCSRGRLIRLLQILNISEGFFLNCSEGEKERKCNTIETSINTIQLGQSLLSPNEHQQKCERFFISDRQSRRFDALFILSTQISINVNKKNPICFPAGWWMRIIHSSWSSSAKLHKTYRADFPKAGGTGEEGPRPRKRKKLQLLCCTKYNNCVLWFSFSRGHTQRLLHFSLYNLVLLWWPDSAVIMSFVQQME